jgi:uncharacterized membrane protein YphA (DoxX/SURF4 family)
MTIVKPRTTGSGKASPAVLALRFLAAMLGVFFLAQGLNKLPWLLDSALLSDRFVNWERDAPPSVRWYIDTIARPGAPLFARLIPLAELATAFSLMLGFWPRLSAALACVMVLNFHFALGSFYQWEALRDGALLPVVGGLLAIAAGGARLPYSVRP